jgi:homoaconitase/3-isopropylmalate dehydratase large subunit
MGMTLADKIISAHLVDGKMEPGEDIAIRVDQTLLRTPPARWHTCLRPSTQRL